MAYIVERKSRFYVVAYDGVDPATGRERRRWHPAGHSRADAEAIADRLDAISSAEHSVVTGQLTLGRYLTEQFMPMRRHRLQPTTAHRYQWMIDNYITPRSARCRCGQCEQSTSTTSTASSSRSAG